MMSPYGKLLLDSIRDYQAHAGHSGPMHRLLRKYARIRHLMWTVLTGSDIDPQMRFGTGLMLPHPNGVVIHQDAVIGNNCMIMQQVTIGRTADEGVPTIGNDVYIGAGAKVLGSVSVGDGARIGAQAVVISDVPAHCTAVGIPAQIIERSPAPVSNTRDI